VAFSFQLTKNMIQNILKIFSLIVITVLLSFCGQKKYSLEDVKAIVQKADANMHGLEETNFEWASKRAYSHIRAYYPLPGYIFLNEKINFRTGGDSYNHYYFKDGNLVYYKERKLTFKKDQRNNWRRVLSSLDLYLNQDGNVVGYDNVEDKKVADLKSEQVEETLHHARELYSITKPKKLN